MISIVINCDTRPERNNEGGMFNGVVSRDFITDGIYNKIKYFNGFDIEVIVFIDEHERIPEETLICLRAVSNCVVIRKHTNEHAFNDYNYVAALQLARGEYVVHFDQDVAAFTSTKEPIEQMINWLNDYKFISYPSHWSPNAVDDPTFEGRMWASTRFFMCKRTTFKFDILKACIDEPNWAYQTFGDVPRRCNWLEHFLTLSTGNSVYYPQINLDEHTIFTWNGYAKDTLRRLNEMPYEEVKQWVLNRGGIQYPVDIKCE